MSIQPLPSAPAAVEAAPVRKRAAESEAGQSGEVFTLPENETPAKVRPEAAAVKAEPGPKALQPSQVAQAAPNVSAPALAGSKPDGAIQTAPASDPSAQIRASALLAAAIAAQAGAPTQADSDKAGDTQDATEEGAEATPSAVDASALPIVAPLPAEDAKPSLAVLQAELSAAAISALSGAVAPAAGSAVDAAAPPVVATPQSAAAIGLAAATGQPANQQNGTVPLQSGEVEPAADQDAAAPASTGAGKPAVHTARATGAEPTSSLAPKDASQPDAKPAEALQPLQGAIELSTLMQARPGRPDGVLPLMTPEQAAAAQPGTSQGQSATGGPPTPLHVVPIEIGLRALAGGRKFDIRLDPAELGRVDVSLDISDNGEVTAKLVVDRVETLHLLQRDARTLERAFEQAGLKPSNAGVDITLRDPADQSGFRQNRHHDEAPRRTPTMADIGEDIGIPAQPVHSTSIRGLLRLGGVDLSI